MHFETNTFCHFEQIRKYILQYKTDTFHNLRQIYFAILDSGLVLSGLWSGLDSELWTLDSGLVGLDSGLVGLDSGLDWTLVWSGLWSGLDSGLV